MGLLQKLFGRRDNDDDDEGGEDVAITLDQDARRRQLVRLEKGLDAVAAAMRSAGTMDNPGWRGRVNEYGRLAGEAMTLARGTITRDAVLDLVFEVRPVFTGTPPQGLEALVPLQEEILSAAEDLRTLRPGERQG